MEYRSLGSSGLKVSVVGLGGNQFGGKVDQAGTEQIVHSAMDLGVNFIDTADVYSRGRSEEVLGVALAGRWDRIVLGTKVRSPMGDGPNDRGASRYHIFEGVHRSLQRLNTDHIDLLQIHSWDAETPIEETMRALDDLVSSGKVRYIGASNYAAWQLCRSNDVAEMRGWAPFVSIQPHYHMFERGIERELVPYCREFGVGILPYFPLAGDFLTGKYREGAPPPAGSRGEVSPYVQRYFTPANFARLDQLRVWAEERGHTMAELAIAWLLAQPQLASVIAGVTSSEQVEANTKAATWRLTPDEEQAVRAILEEQHQA
ncbi:MAG TPA: aldo/keto reductase [Herpetosiphonaceae bacterium]|nr:aldo/keto reductase [Herpetosiphonaceae bacterium]